ncbi:hypothetical protein O181_051770 [Austropuccinia psidii MF-1]|uniref:Uncharacterized protein n=1 Tax=Austropuccinia psidii MF-1 TaxID=1389203 RepID=A0A9Q3DXQ5_9BASI|nr:hypothetical protein [Austropuccinia psidii MF-1]
MASEACRPLSMGPLGPFWPKYNETKRGQPPAPKPQVGSPEPILAPNLNIPKNGQKDPRTKIGKEPHFGHLSTSGLQKPPDQDQQDSPLSSGEELSFTKGFRHGAYMV